MSSAIELYTNLLRRKGLGDPLWIPEPDNNLPSQYREVGVSIGDVGIITSDGAFDFLFNIRLPATHPVNEDSVPGGFMPFSFADTDVVNDPAKFLPGTVIASSDRADGEKLDRCKILREGNFSDVSTGPPTKISFEHSEHAFLILPDGASRQDLINVDELSAYMLQNVAIWFPFVIGRRGPLASPFIVTGCDKATSWAMGSFTRPTKAVLAGQAGEISYSWQSEISAYQQTRFSLTPSGTQNQCIFVRGMTISVKNKRPLYPGLHVDNASHSSQQEVSSFHHIHVCSTKEKDTNSHSNIVVKSLRCATTDRIYIDKVVSGYKTHLVPIWSRLSHKNIVPLLAICVDDGTLPTIELPYYKANIVDNNASSSGTTKLAQIKHVAAGIKYLHEMGVCHGNICPTNILIKDDGGVCISDPGFNILMRRITYGTYAPVPATWCYKPAEELLDATIGPKADVYSWASLVYEIFCGKRPYHDYHYARGIVRIINYGHRALDRPPEISPKLWSIMQKCWMLDAEDRPTMIQVDLELRSLE